LTLPTVQLRALIARLAALSVLPFSLGTTHGFGRGLKVAVTVCSLMPVFTWQVPVPVQPPPDQPLKRDPAAGVAVSLSEVPASNEAVQVAPQSIPARELDTVPEPLPCFEMSSVTAGAEPPISSPPVLPPPSA
jgi:hypothetical protein